MYEFLSVAEKNVATPEYGSKTICGERPLDLLNGDVITYNGNDGMRFKLELF